MIMRQDHTPTHLALSRLLLLVSELTVLLRGSLSNISSRVGGSFLVGEVVMGLRLAAFAAIMEARSEGLPLSRLVSLTVWSMDWDWALLWW